MTKVRETPIGRLAFRGLSAEDSWRRGCTCMGDHRTADYSRGGTKLFNQLAHGQSCAILVGFLLSACTGSDNRTFSVRSLKGTIL